MLEKTGLRLKRERCAFLMPDVEYLGHKICWEGLQPTEPKVQAVAEAPEPQRVAELRSFLGLLNYYDTNRTTSGPTAFLTSPSTSTAFWISHVTLDYRGRGTVIVSLLLCLPAVMHGLYHVLYIFLFGYACHLIVLF